MDEPFLLTSFPLPSTSSALAYTPSVTAIAYPSSSSSSASKKEGTRFLVTAPAIGLTSYDLVDQTALSSITVGTAFAPCARAVSRSTSTSTAKSAAARATRYTWVPVTSSEHPERGEIWHWSEQERKDGSTEPSPSKLVYPVSNPIVGLSAPRTLPSHLLLLSSSGTLALAASQNLAILATFSIPSRLSNEVQPTSQSLRVLQLRKDLALLPRSVQELVPGNTNAHLVLVSRAYSGSSNPTGEAATLSKKPRNLERAPKSGNSEDQRSIRTVVEVLLVDPEVHTEDEMEAQARIATIGWFTVTADQVAYNEDGYLTTLNTEKLASHRLAFPTKFPTTTYADLFISDDAQGCELMLSPIKTQRLASSLISPFQTKILALHSSFVLLCCLRPASTRPDETSQVVISLIWDVRLGAIVTHNTIAIPSSVSTTRDCQLSLDLPSVQTATLSLTPIRSGTSTMAAASGRIAIYSIPLAGLPSGSVLAAAVGKHNITRQYIKTGEDEDSTSKFVEPIRPAKISAAKTALLESSAQARVEVFLNLQRHLKVGDANVEVADRVFADFIESETKALRAYHVAKLDSAFEKERDRRIAALKTRDALKMESGRYKTARRRIEEAITESGVAPDAWPEVTAKRIKGVSDVYRYGYYEDRKQLEASMGKVGIDQSREKAMATIEKIRPNIPSSFVTAVLKLCFPERLSSQDLTATSTPKHPCGILSYMLDNRLASDSQIQGSLTKELAASNDWLNVQKALANLPDIPEAITTSILQRVITSSLASTSSSTGVPSLEVFLGYFVASPSTPSELRQALRDRLTAIEAYEVLRVCKKWLSWWSRHGLSAGASEQDQDAVTEIKPKRLRNDPFAPKLTHIEADRPPQLDSVLSLVQAILDAHFLSLLLYRPCHAFLKKLASRIEAHLKDTTELESLAGAMSIYSRAKIDQRSSNHKAEKKTVENNLGESMKRRVEAQEKHAQVGAYEIETFYL